MHIPEGAFGHVVQIMLSSILVARCLRAIEDKRFLPVGADKEAQSEFQLLAGTNRDLGAAVAAGEFRDDLYARLNLWTFTMPGLADRGEDIEPNLDYELDRFAEREGDRASFNKEARQRYLAFAMSPQAHWPGNFRDLAASVTRMATLSPKGRIEPSHVNYLNPEAGPVSAEQFVEWLFQINLPAADLPIAHQPEGPCVRL